MGARWQVSAVGALGNRLLRVLDFCVGEFLVGE